MVPTVSLIAILSLGNPLSVGFEKAYLMQNPSLYEVADVIATYVYREGISAAKYSYGAAVGFLESIVAFALVAAANTLARRFSEYTLW